MNLMYQQTYICVYIHTNGILYVVFTINYLCLSIHLEYVHLLNSFGWQPSIPSCDYSVVFQPFIDFEAVTFRWFCWNVCCPFLVHFCNYHLVWAFFTSFLDLTMESYLSISLRFVFNLCHINFPNLLEPPALLHHISRELNILSGVYPAR